MAIDIPNGHRLMWRQINTSLPRDHDHNHAIYARDVLIGLVDDIGEEDESMLDIVDACKDALSYAPPVSPEALVKFLQPFAAYLAQAKSEHNEPPAEAARPDSPVAETTQTDDEHGKIEVPSLFRAKNLMFLTRTDDNLPTLYFSHGQQWGRLRQEHDKGPRVTLRKNNTNDYFFFTHSEGDAFYTELLKAKKQKEEIPTNAVDYGAIPEPGTDLVHYDATYDDEGIVLKVHKSRGLVDTQVTAYDDAAIKKIYRDLMERRKAI